MNVLIDLRWMVIGKAGGMEQLAYEMVAALDRNNSGDRIFVYCPRRTFREWDLNAETDLVPIYSEEHDLVPEHLAFEDFAGGPTGHSRKLGVVRKGRGLSADRFILEIDLVHSIGGYLSEDLMGYCSVVTILDLQHVHYPDFFSPGEVQARERNHRRAIAASECVICISDAVKNDVCRHYSVAEEKAVSIWVIPSSVAWIRIAESELTRTLSRLGVAGEYLFFPSHAWPHKNHEKLLRAFAEARKVRPALSLVLTGGHYDSQNPARRLIDQLGLQESVKHLGYRTPLEIRCLLQGSRMLVYPSLFEGFGLPVAEAIIAGVPVACSNIAPLVEIGGGAIVKFNPRDVTDMAEKIIALATDERLRDKTLSEAKNRRNLFSANSIGRDTLNLYRSVCGLDPFAKPSSTFVPSLRRERARHGLRRFDERCDQPNLPGAIVSWSKACVHDPVLACTVLTDKLFSKKTDSIPFCGRYEDGWIGPRYEGWLLAKKDSNQLQIEFEGPPPTLRKGLSISIAINSCVVSVCDFGVEEDLVVTVDLPGETCHFLLVEVESSQSFNPRDCGFSEDPRELSLKLKSLRWIHGKR